MAQQLPLPSEWRLSIARMLQARKAGVDAPAYEAALRDLGRFKHLPVESRSEIYQPRHDVDDHHMLENLVDLLCSPKILRHDDGRASETINILTAILFVELGRDELANHDVLNKCIIGRLPLKVNRVA